MDTLEIIRSLAIIIIFSKFFGLCARKIKAPEVAGEIIAGLLIGPSVFNFVQKGDFIAGMAEIGVILLMFSAGLDTNINQLKKSGIKATILACVGVVVPFIGGFLLYSCFYGFSKPGTEHYTSALFIGCILTATSVSITVQALKELGKISTEVGTTIMSAAIIDDVIGIIVLTAVISTKSSNTSIGMVALKTVLFFVMVLVLGYLCFRLMEIIDERYPKTRRIPILGLFLAFSLSYIADEYFGVADITGAFCAGVILSSLRDSDYIERKMDINSYMIFGPVFFTSIGLQTDLKELDMTILVFSVVFVIVGLLCKVIGCGITAKLEGYKLGDSLKIGVGMMTRGEVALIVAQRGIKYGLSSKFFTSVILLIVISSILTPIILKALYAKEETVVKANA